MEAQPPESFAVAVLVGLLIGEGHFGGDGKQPQIALRMHTKHRSLFEWIQRQFPGGKLYGPYSHGGRDYMQWMVRGAYLREHLLPLLAPHIEEIDEHVASRLRQMCEQYRVSGVISRVARRDS